jgi:hypothetical protein
MHLRRPHPPARWRRAAHPAHAGNYIAGLPKREHDAPAWVAAIQALMLVAEHGGDTMLPRIGIMRALYPDETPLTPRRKRKRSRRSATGSFDEVLSEERCVDDGDGVAPSPHYNVR